MNATTKLTVKCRNSIASDWKTPRLANHPHRQAIATDATHGTTIRLIHGFSEVTSRGEGATRLLSDPRIKAIGT